MPDNRSAVMLIANATRIGTNVTHVEFDDMDACVDAQDALNEWYEGESDRPRFICIPTEQ